METFYNLIEQIAQLSVEEVEKLKGSYETLIEGMVNNTELINETRQSMKMSGMPTVDINHDKELIYKLTDTITF